MREVKIVNIDVIYKNHLRRKVEKVIDFNKLEKYKRILQNVQEDHVVIQ